MKKEFLRNAWYVGAWAHEVSRKLTSRTILGESLLLYRKENGEPVAIGNRCPHRFAPLDMGKLIGDVVQCRYHGLRFDSIGKCVLNPHDTGRIPPKMVVPGYPAVEKHKLIWLWFGDNEKMDLSTIPDFSCHEDPNLALVGGMFEIRANYELVSDNLLDLSHGEFVHEGVLSSEAITLSKLETIQNGTTVYSNRWCPNGEAAPAWRAAFDNYDKPVDHWLYMRWDAPAHMLLDVGVCPVGGKREEGVWAYGTDIITPKDEFTSYYFWGVTRGYKIDDPSADQFWRIAIKSAFEEQDEPIIEAQQLMLGTQDLEDAQPVMFSVDAASSRARRVLAKLINQQETDLIARPSNPNLAKLRETGRESCNPVVQAV